MRIQKYSMVSENELLSRLKRTRLKGLGQPEVYRDASLEILEQADPQSLAPAQRFVLAGGIECIIALHDAFLQKGIDIFALRGALLFWPEGVDPDIEPPTPLLPPVVEESREPDGRSVLIINDGIHRVYAARKLGRSINVVLARNVPADYPYYAYALPNGWAEVEEISELQSGYQKKEYRNPDNYKALFRNFNEVFEGVQKQRKQTNPEHLRA
jgi:hypothetical protein